MRNISIFTDGGARGNPGPAALGVVIKDGGETIAAFGQRLGETTNNIAEYSAVLAALNWIITNKEKVGEASISFFMDSQLIYSQIKGIYKIKNEKLRELLFEVRKKEAEIKMPIFYNHIPREKNKEADKFVNKALDNTL